MWLDTQRYTSDHLLTHCLDFHQKNLLFALGVTPIRLHELLAKDKALSIYGDPAQSFNKYILDDGVPVCVYHSQPICLLSDGDPISFDDLVVKISDFGKGILPLSFDTS
jgi:hypothetical protein